MYIDIDEIEGKYYVIHVFEDESTKQLSIGLDSELEAELFIEKLVEEYYEEDV